MVNSEISNRFADYIRDIRNEIKRAPGKISVNWDLWTADTSKLSYFGLAAQWISVEDGSWMFRAEVIACHRILGAHNGTNLGHYFMRFTERVGITSKDSKTSNVCYVSCEI